MRTQYQNNLGKIILLISIIFSSLSVFLVMTLVVSEFLRPSFLFFHLFFIFVIMPFIMMQKLPILSLVIEKVDHPENSHIQFHFFGKPSRRTLIFPLEPYIELRSKSLIIEVKNSEGKIIKLPRYFYKDKEKFSWKLIENRLKIINYKTP